MAKKKKTARRSRGFVSNPTASSAATISSAGAKTFQKRVGSGIGGTGRIS